MNSKSLTSVDMLHGTISSKLIALGENSPYSSDANEPDPRYLGYGVRAPEMKRFLASLKPELSVLDTEQQVELATLLIGSGYGEQKTVGIALLEKVPDHFRPERFDQIENLVSGLHGWSKIDSVTSVFLPSILKKHPQEMIERLGHWNASEDRWLRRASIVVFTRKVAQLGTFKDVALRHCSALIHDEEHLVQTGVGWCLRDQMRRHKTEMLDYVMELRRKGVSSTITLYALRDIKGEERRAILNQRALSG